jgi:hypothetical protein
MTLFTPNQIVSLSCQNISLYGEVIQVISTRSSLWVRPLWLILANNLDIIDVREGSDLILPIDLFRPALDTEVIPLFSKIIKNPSPSTDYLQDFVRKICHNYPVYFQKSL